ncbi:MAG: hypothetical protein AVDCRST_MAG70-2512, partial [uncultured Thermomicrobiales bacterium]
EDRPDPLLHRPAMVSRGATRDRSTQRGDGTGHPPTTDPGYDGL